jgi:hypothetical protein
MEAQTTHAQIGCCIIIVARCMYIRVHAEKVVHGYIQVVSLATPSAILQLGLGRSQGWTKN